MLPEPLEKGEHGEKVESWLETAFLKGFGLKPSLNCPNLKQKPIEASLWRFPAGSNLLNSTLKKQDADGVTNNPKVPQMSALKF